jgi:queuine tRNA-ribosyltransferase
VLDDDGVTFRSHLDGSAHRFTPENVVAFQEDLGVDIAMMLDECVALPATPEAIGASVRRTSLWAARAERAWKRGATALFAIVQGGLDESMRARSAADLTALDLPGYAIGGLSVGESRADMDRLTRFSAALLPTEKPRYLMGVGTVRDLITGIDAGVDMFDCVYPTRSGRHGRAITRTGEFNIRNATYARDESPIDPACACAVCRTFTRAYLSHLFRSEELLGPRLLSYHNLAALAALTQDAREAIAGGRWAAFRDTFSAATAAS